MHLEANILPRNTYFLPALGRCCPKNQCDSGGNYTEIHPTIIAVIVYRFVPQYFRFSPRKGLLNRRNLANDA